MTVGITEVFTLVPALYPTIELAGAAYPAWTAGQAFKPGGATAFTPRSPGHVLTAGSISAFPAARPTLPRLQHHLTGATLSSFAFRMGTDRTPARA